MNSYDDWVKYITEDCDCDPLKGDAWTRHANDWSLAHAGSALDAWHNTTAQLGAWRATPVVPVVYSKPLEPTICPCGIHRSRCDYHR